MESDRKRQGPINRYGCRCAFTLVEVLIVVLIVAVLAAVIIPQFSSTTKDASASALESNLHIMRSQIELYKMDHLGDCPTIQGTDLPQLTSPTNSNGEIGPAGPAYPYGPYMEEVPPNPFDGSSKVSAVSMPGAKPAGISGNLGGWQYDESTGDIWPNHPEYYQ